MAVLLASWGDIKGHWKAVSTFFKIFCKTSRAHHLHHASVLIYEVSSWLLCAPRCDGGPWCCWCSGCDRWHTNASCLLSYLWREHRWTLKTHKDHFLFLKQSPMINSKWLAGGKKNYLTSFRVKIKRCEIISHHLNLIQVSKIRIHLKKNKQTHKPNAYF